MRQATPKYHKENDIIYCNLLRLACHSNKSTNNESNAQMAIDSLNQIPKYAKVHKRLIPLLYRQAKSLNVLQQLNNTAQHILKSGTQLSVISQLAKQQQLSVVVNELSIKHNIPVILLKSTAFNHKLYHKSYPRSSNDLDLLVQPKHWQQAKQILAKVMQYQAKAMPDVFGDAYEVSYIPKGKVGDSVDLHMALINPLLFPINQNYLWTNSTQHPVFNHENIKELSPECALVHQAIHAYSDMNFCKYNLVDSAEIINQLQPNMQLMVNLAKQWQASLPMYLLLKNINDVLGITIDKTVLKLIKPSPVKHKIATWLLNSEHNQPKTKPY